MISTLIAFFVSLIISLIIIRTQQLHGDFSCDPVLKGPQKFHTIAVPRIGGLAIGIALATSLSTNYLLNPQDIKMIVALICAAPVFGIGIAEDILKKISIRARLVITGLSALLACLFLNLAIPRIDVPAIDLVLSLGWPSILFVVFSITGLTNAYNIIDGFNGLASMVGMITLLALGYLSIKLSDPLLIFMSFSMAGAIMGFFLLNYPRGLIFLGDCGAYLIGFWIAIISIFITNRHPQISPWFAFLINAYPIIETLFSIYRRKFHQSKSPGHPDGIHFHTLIYRRVLKTGSLKNESLSANARTSPYLWVLSGLPIAAALLWPYSSLYLECCSIIFIVLYVWLYSRIVHFNTPKWLHIFY